MNSMINLAKGTFVGVIALVSVVALPAVASADDFYFGSGGDVFDGYFGSGGDVYDGYFGSGDVYDGYFGSGDVYDGYFGSGDVYDGYFGSGGVYDGYFGSGDVYDGYFGSGGVYDGYFGSGEVYDGYLGSGEVYDGYIGSGEVYDGYIGSGSVQDGYIGSGSVQDGYIGSGSVQDGYIGTGSVQDGYMGQCGEYCYEPVYNEACQCYQAQYSPMKPFAMPFQSLMSVVPPRFSPPSHPSFPSYPTPPRPTPPAPQPPRPQPPVPQPPVPQPPVNPGHCVNNSCNTTNTNTNVNNNNVNTNVTTVTQATPGPIVQYVAPQYPVYPSVQAPFCVITIGQGYAVGMISLTWSSQGYVTSAYISPSVGQVAPNGSTSLYGYGSSVYSLTVTGPNGTYTCHTQSYIAPVAPVSPYVSLTQIPYTGLALGPIGNVLYWLSLVSLAVGGAYLLVYYKGGALALATSMIARSQRTAEQPAHAPEAEVAHFELPTSQTATRDAMQIVRDAQGNPRLVISRA